MGYSKELFMQEQPTNRELDYMLANYYPKGEENIAAEALVIDLGNTFEELENELLELPTEKVVYTTKQPQSVADLDDYTQHLAVVYARTFSNYMKLRYKKGSSKEATLKLKAFCSKNYKAFIVAFISAKYPPTISPALLDELHDLDTLLFNLENQ